MHTPGPAAAGLSPRAADEIQSTRNCTPMTIRMSALALLALGFSAAPGTHAATYEGGLLANHLWADSPVGTAKGFGVSLDALRLYNDREGITLRLSRTGLELGPADIDRETVSTGYWRYLDDLAGFRPYLTGAIGYGRLESGPFDDDGLILEAAGGLVSRADFLIPGLKFRAELRLGWDDAGDGDAVAGIGAGLHYAFGGSTAAATPAKPASAPAPAPAPAATSDDNDGDGVRNSADACPDTPAGAKVDARGCVDVAKVVLKGVSFAVASATLRPEATPTLGSVAAALIANPGLRIEVQGHSDAQGDPARNMTLSERRAQAVKSFLVKEGIAADRISVKGFGQTQPVASNATAAGRADNRRVEFRIVAQ